jgi:hypothetical protein
MSAAASAAISMMLLAHVWLPVERVLVFIADQ